jgi:MFS family permease
MRARRLPPVVTSLGVVSFFNDLASEMMYPLLPAMMTSLGGSAVSLGFLDGVAEAVSAGTKLVAGRLANQARHRRGLVVAGYAVAALVRPLVGVAARVWQVIVLRATDRVGKGIRTPARDAVIADATPREIRGKAFGFHRSMDHAGAIVGPLLGWWMIARAGMSPAQVITWSAVPGVVAVLVVTWAMKEAGTGSGSAPGGGRREEGRVVAPEPKRPEVRDRAAGLVFSLIILFWLARFPEALILLRLQELGLPIAMAPLVWAALHVVRTAASYPGGTLADRLGPARTMLAGWVVYGVVCVGLATAASGSVAAGWFLLFGSVAALTEAPERAFIGNLRGGAGTGSRFGVYHAATGFAALAGGVILGLLYRRSGATVALMASAAVVTILVGVAIMAGLLVGANRETAKPAG